ncbi:Phage antirepressor protein [Azospirillum argentinense]|uniref:Rha family transcriptional regulator n=1 Tax=Azospirillum argentinense TaxID=2970906 RepID=UPI0032DEF301
MSENMKQDGPEGKEPVVFVDGGSVRTNSLDVSSYFRKDHKNVLRDVRKLIGRRPELNRLKFALVERPDAKGELRPTYDMDRDGFTLLAMGFTGEEALDFKLQYIERFNEMEKALKEKRVPVAEVMLSGYQEVRDISMDLRLITECRQTWGNKAAQQMWLKRRSLPTVPAMYEDPSQPNLFSYTAVPKPSANNYPPAE